MIEKSRSAIMSGDREESQLTPVQLYAGSEAPVSPPQARFSSWREIREARTQNDTENPLTMSNNERVIEPRLIVDQVDRSSSSVDPLVPEIDVGSLGFQLFRLEGPFACHLRPILATFPEEKPTSDRY